jgi:hypothetical protein
MQKMVLRFAIALVLISVCFMYIAGILTARPGWGDFGPVFKSGTLAIFLGVALGGFVYWQGRNKDM